MTRKSRIRKQQKIQKRRKTDERNARIVDSHFNAYVYPGGYSFDQELDQADLATIDPLERYLKEDTEPSV